MVGVPWQLIMAYHVPFAFALSATVQGQNISEVAAEFSAKHVLSPAMAQKLHGLLREADIETNCSEKMGNHKKTKSTSI